MSKVREVKNKEGRNEPYPKVMYYEKYLNELTQKHKNKFDNLKHIYKNVTDETQKLRQDLKNSQNTIKKNREELNIEKIKLTKAVEEKNKLVVENTLLKQEFLELQQKLSYLEVTYDQSVKNLSTQISKLNQDMQHQSNTSDQLTNQLTENRNALQEALTEKTNKIKVLTDELLKLTQDFEDYKNSSVVQHEEKTKALQVELAEVSSKLIQNSEEVLKIRKEMNEMEEAKNTELSEVNSNLQQKCEEVLKIRKEMEELEEAKNKTIEAQLFRIREIERCLTQPLHRVQPQLNQNRSASPKHVEPFQYSNQQSVASMPSTSAVANSNIQASSTVQTNASYADRQQSAHARRNRKVPSVSGSRHTERYPATYNSFSDSGSETDVPHYVPFSLDDNNNIRGNVVAISPIRGFGILKRASSVLNEVQETTESERSFSKLKRSRK